jgi:hypothetical protein
MKNKNTRVWIWMEEYAVQKAVYNPGNRTLIVYNEQDEIILKRTGISLKQLPSLEALFFHFGAKRIDGQKEPFTYL